ncbi:Flp family type IVb pilin [Streptomyces sp. NPDC004788]
MNEALLKVLTKAKVRAGSWDAARREGDRGQTAVEYLGIIVVVVAIVVAITGTSIGQEIRTAIGQKIADLTGGK